MRRLLLYLSVLTCLVPLVISHRTPPAHHAKPAPTKVAAHVASSITSITVPDAERPPAFDRDFPDPSVLRVGRIYYAFATHTAWEPPGHVFPILESSDLATWRSAGDVFSAPPRWGVGDWWAPAVVARGNDFFLYYSGLNPSGFHCIAVATATMPAGPYTDHGPIACTDGTAAIGYIDAWPLLAGDRGYLYFSVDGPDHHSISVLPLSADMLAVAGPRVELFGVTQGWEEMGHGTVEGPSVFAWGSQYVLLYSGGDWRQRYGMGYAVAGSPTGPFVKTGGQLLTNGGLLAGPGGGSFFTDVRGRPWLAFHGWAGAGRVLYVAPLSISPA